jgi:dTMP kinase
MAFELNRIATGELVPVRTLLLQATDAERVQRIRDRGDGDDRLELADAESFKRIDARYRLLAADEPERVRVINASQPIADVLAAAYDAIADLLPEAAR